VPYETHSSLRLQPLRSNFSAPGVFCSSQRADGFSRRNHRSNLKSGFSRGLLAKAHHTGCPILSRSDRVGYRSRQRTTAFAAPPPRPRILLRPTTNSLPSISGCHPDPERSRRGRIPVFIPPRSPRTLPHPRDATGANLPLHFAPWTSFKSIELTRDEPTPGLNTNECLDAIEKYTFHITDAHTRITPEPPSDPALRTRRMVCASVTERFCLRARLQPCRMKPTSACGFSR
jgi:hypothetical protein